MDHAFFIWSAYGISAVVLAWTAIAPMLRGRRALAKLRLIDSKERPGDTDT